MMPILEKPRDFATRFNLDLPTVAEAHSEEAKELIISEERTAVHSGKLGDIIYALPTVRLLGVNHLVLNAFYSASDPLRNFSASMAQQLVPLLLHQEYLQKVSITKGTIPLEDAWNGISGIDYNLDAFRNVARHRVDYRYAMDPEVQRYTDDAAPLHLAQAFAAAQGLRLDLEEKWIDAPANPEAAGHVVVSLTNNWRSYPNWYWAALLKGIPKLLFVGSEKEFKQAGIAHARLLKTENHLELASWIAGCHLFLGTISFPFALAEGLKVPRLVELCYRQLNAFPVGPSGKFLPPNVIRARKLVEGLLPTGDGMVYERVTRQLTKNPLVLTRQTRLTFQLRSRRTTKTTLSKIRATVGRWRKRIISLTRRRKAFT